jgi:hypothetical protein
MRIVRIIASLLGLLSFGLLVLVLFVFLLLLLRQAFPIEPTPVFPKRDAQPEPNQPYLTAEEAVLAPATEDTSTPGDEPPILLPVESVLFEYVEVIDSCGPHFEGDCLNARSGPGTEFPSVGKLRSGVVLKVGGKVETASSTWYKIVFDEWLRYPERLAKNFYIAAEYVEILRDEGDRTHDGISTSTKRILVDRSEQKLYAYDGEALFMETSISTGLELTPTPRGTFTIFKKTPSRYMQGPLPYLAVSKYYDLPGVPWNLYFTEQGAVIHGAYWHDSFGKRYSSGCVNMRPDEARSLYTWAELGTTVTVRD